MPHIEPNLKNCQNFFFYYPNWPGRPTFPSYEPHSRRFYTLFCVSVLILFTYSVSIKNLAAFSKYSMPEIKIQFIFKESNSVGATLGDKFSENSIESVNLEITKLFSCQHHCTAKNLVPELSDRKLLKPQSPDEALHKQWGTSKKEYIAGMHRVVS